MNPNPFPDWSLSERMAYKERIELDDEKRVQKPEATILRETHTISHEVAMAQVRDLGRLLVGMGRDIEVHMNTMSQPGVPYKTGKRKGEMRPDRVFDNYALATVDKRLPVVYDAKNITELKKWVREGIASG